MSARSKDTPTIPATPDSRRVNTSGMRPATTEPLPGDEAHAEMLRAVQRGDCVLVSEQDSGDGLIVQWSAWLAGNRVICQMWRRDERSWAPGVAFAVEPQVMSSLAQLLERAREAP